MYIYRLHLPSASRKLLHFSKFVKNCWFLFWHRQKEICIKYALLPLPEFLGTECQWQHRMLWILYDSFPGNLVQDKSERIWRLMAVAPWPGSLVMVQPGDYCPLPPHWCWGCSSFHTITPAQAAPHYCPLLPPDPPFISIWWPRSSHN